MRMGVFINIRSCDCCGGDHADLELFGGWVPRHVKIWRELSCNSNSSWFLCPVFGYAVLVNLAQLGPREK